MTDSTHNTDQRKAKQPADHNARQDPLNTAIKQQTGQNMKKTHSEQPQGYTNNTRAHLVKVHYIKKLVKDQNVNCSSKYNI